MCAEPGGTMLPSEGKTPYVNFWSKLSYCHFWDIVDLLYHVEKYFESIMLFLERKLRLNITLLKKIPKSPKTKTQEHLILTYCSGFCVANQTIQALLSKNTLSCVKKVQLSLLLTKQAKL